MKAFFFSALAISLVTLFGCKSTPTNSNPNTFTGSSISIDSGSAYTWIKTDASGNFRSIGVTISDGALTSLGQTDTMFELPIPSGFSSPFKSVMLDYATHDPAPYNHPHIDPHFFYINMAARMNIMDTMDSTMPMNMTMPSGYMTDDMSEAMMGVHWMDTTGPEYHGQPFESTCVYGFTKGTLAFMEVMCDKASLEGHKAITGTVRQPMMMSGMTMSIPASYKVSYDSSAHTSTIEFDGF